MNLKEYVNKKVKIIDIDDKEWKGKVMSVDLAVNYDDIEYDELDLKIDGRDGVVAFPENEIISIEIIQHSIKVKLVECYFYAQKLEVILCGYGYFCLFYL